MLTAPLHILLIEDNDDHAQLIRELLVASESPAPLCTTVHDLQSAFQALERDRFDLILLDLFLPDGDEATSLPATLKQAPSIPVIVLTSLNNIDHAVEAVKQGAQDYLVKSELTSELLLRAIQYAIERHRNRAELRRSNEFLSHFAQTVAHEIRSPLTSVQLFLTTLEDRWPGTMDDEVRRLLERNIKKVSSIGAVISDLLSYADAGVQAPNERVDLEGVVLDVLAQLDGQIRESHAEIHLSELPTVFGNRTQLQQLLYNLISNAIKYQEADSTPEVTIASDRVGDTWHIRVADNGIGFTEEQGRRIFDLFQRAHADRFEGTGIGLTYSRRIVESHGGTIHVESVPGEGSTFTFTIPEPDASNPTEAVTREQDLRTAASSKRESLR